jgi:hypothetical protein
MKQDSDRTRKLVASLLARADYASQYLWRHVCVDAVFAAGRFRLEETRQDIERGIAAGLGKRIGSNEIPRGKLMRALYHTGGDQSFAFLESLYQKNQTRPEPGHSDEWADLFNESACVTAAQLMMRPQDEVIRRRFEDIWHYYAEMERASEKDFISMIVLMRAMEEAELSGHRAMLEAFSELRAKPSQDHVGRWRGEVIAVARRVSRLAGAGS